MLASLTVTAQAATLYAVDIGGNIFTVNENSGLGTLVGDLGPVFCCTEIEYDNQNHVAWAQYRNGEFTASAVDINTATLIGTPVFNGVSFNGLEYVGGTLYGAYITGPDDSATFATLNPATGAVAIIGPTGTGHPLSGLAFDVANEIMYGIDGGSGLSDLWTINMNTGVATLIGNTQIQAGSLQFGMSGQLFTGGSGVNSGEIWTIDTATASASFLGDSGFLTVSGLTLASPIPIPAAFWLFGSAIGLLGLMKRRSP